MTIVRSFARVAAVISSLLLLTVYVWYRGGGLQAVAPPAQDGLSPVPAAAAQSEGSPASTTAVAPPATSQEEFIFVPVQTAPAPKALMSSSKVLVPGFNPKDADAISKSIAAVRAGPQAPVDEISPSLPIASPRREIMGGSKSKTIAVDLSAKELEALRYEIARIRAQIARLEGRAEPKPASAAPAPKSAMPATTERKTIMYSSKSGMIVLPPEPQSQTQSQVKAATQWTRQQSASRTPGN